MIMIDNIILGQYLLLKEGSDVTPVELAERFYLWYYIHSLLFVFNHIKIIIALKVKINWYSCRTKIRNSSCFS